MLTAKQKCYFIYVLFATINFAAILLFLSFTNLNFFLWIHYHQWRQLGAGGRRPQDSQLFFWLDSLIQCSIYVHTYQALVNFSTWIDFNRGCWYGAFGITAQKNFPYAIKNFAPPKKFVNWHHWLSSLILYNSCLPFYVYLHLELSIFMFFNKEFTYLLTICLTAEK